MNFFFKTVIIYEIAMGNVTHQQDDHLGYSMRQMKDIKMNT